MVAFSMTTIQYKLLSLLAFGYFIPVDRNLISFTKFKVKELS